MSVLSIIVGSTLYTYGLTNIITVAVGMQRDKTAFQEKMDALNSYMAYREVPGSLQAKIRTYLAERSSKGRSWDEKERELLSELSPQLQAKVAIVVNRAVLKRTRFLWRTTPEFVTRLILSMAHQHFPPDEYVAVEEDPADRLFILTKGTVDLLKWGRFRVQSISGRSRDAFFGELALLGESRAELAPCTPRLARPEAAAGRATEAASPARTIRARPASNPHAPSLPPHPCPQSPPGRACASCRPGPARTATSASSPSRRCTTPSWTSPA